MSKNGLFSVEILSFVFAPLVFTIILLLYFGWNRVKGSRPMLPTMDMPGLVLAAAVRWMPEGSRDWGRAMMGELGQVHGLRARWWFALSCVRVALFPPQRSELVQLSLANRNPVCGLLAIVLPPLGLPFIYFTTVIVEAIGGSPFTQASRWSNPDAITELANVIVKLTFLCLLAGLPLGIAGLLRGERLRALSVMGMLLSTGIVGYFLVVMSFVAGGPNGD